MDEKYRKPALIAVAVLALLIVIGIATGAGEKLGRFATISANIASNLAHPSHGDTRSLETITVEYIENHTGSTSEVEEQQLPKAFRPLQKYRHPPFSMGACQVCHAPKRSKPAAIITKTVGELCYNCHEPKEEMHEAIDCNRCHNPHHAQRKHLLREKVSEEECPVGTFKH